LFQDNPGTPVPEKTSVLLDFYGAGKDNGGRSTDSWDGGHPNWTKGAFTPTTPPQSFLQAGCPSCRPTNSVKALTAINNIEILLNYLHALEDKMQLSVTYIDFKQR